MKKITYKVEIKIDEDQLTLDSSERNRQWEEKRQYFKDYCVNRFQWYNYPKWQYVHDFPLHVDFEVSFRCNMQCAMCFRSHIDRKDWNDMDFDLFKKGIDECAENNLYSIRLSWRGESTLNPRLIDMIAYAKEKGIKEVSFLTNGMLIDKSYSKELINAGLDYITFSVDTMYEEYEKLRYPAKFEKIVENIKNLYEIRDSIGNGYPRIKIQSIWKYMGHISKEFYNYFKDFSDLINFNEYDDYSEVDLKLPSDFQCQYPWQRINITWSGEIPMCISDWSLTNVIGDLRYHTIKEVWLGDKINKVRKIHKEGKRLKYNCCKKCSRLREHIVKNRPEGK